MVFFRDMENRFWCELLFFDIFNNLENFRDNVILYYFVKWVSLYNIVIDIMIRSFGNILISIYKYLKKFVLCLFEFSFFCSISIE